MSKTLEKKEAGLQQSEEFPNLEYIVLDIRKRLIQDKIAPSDPGYEKNLDAVIRTTLLKEKLGGILKPGQPSEEKQEWLDRIRQELVELKKDEDWIVKSSERHQLREERRAGQTYSESDLE